MTIAAIMQPTYLPWVGYFDLIDQADTFILDDLAQFTRRSWQCRNRILARDGNVVWMTIPTLSPHRRPLNEIRINNTQDWYRKHKRTIEAAYSEAGDWRFARARNATMLSEYTGDWIRSLCFQLGIGTRIVRASDLGPLREGRLERLADMLHTVQATELLDTAGAKDVLGVANIEGIPIRWHEYEPQPYNQGGQEWFPGLSVIDCLAWCGPDALDVIRAGRIVNSAATP